MMCETSAISALDISVVIVNWNTRELLLECVASLLQETQQSSLEIIVVDNGSTDGSMTALAQHFPQLQQIRNSENVGFSRANNQGIQIARGRYLCLVNSDIKALDGVLDKLRAFMDAHADVGAIAPRTLDGDRKLHKNCREYPTLRNVLCQVLFLDKLFPSARALRGEGVYGYDYATPQDIEVLSGCFLMVRREVVEQVGALDERFFIYSEDVDWCKRIRSAGWKLIFYPDSEAIHYGASSSAVEGTRFSVEMMKANLQYWRKHHGLLRTLTFSVLRALGTTIRAVAWSALVILRKRDRGEAMTRASRYWRLLQWLMVSGFVQAVTDAAVIKETPQLFATRAQTHYRAD